jgi:hypothetical protein
MVIKIKIENLKDATGELKRVMWVTVETAIEGIGTFSSFADLGNDTPLAKELDGIVTDMLHLKKLEITKNNKKKLIAKRKKK